MAEEVVKIIKIQTEGAERTVRSLKQEISNLRDAMLNVDSSSEEYRQIVEKLVDDQKELTNVMRAGKDEVQAATGSYNALQNEMTALRKVWKEVTDESERSRIGLRIKEINDQLKEMDASIGNNQRKVGSYEEALTKAFKTPRQQIKELREQLAGLEKGTEEYNQTLQKLADVTAEQRKLNEQLAFSSQDLGDRLSNVAKLGTAIVGGISAINGVMELFGANSEQMEKATKRMLAFISIVQGLEKLEKLGDIIRGLIPGLASMGLAGAGAAAEFHSVAGAADATVVPLSRMAAGEYNVSEKAQILSQSIGALYKEMVSLQRQMRRIQEETGKTHKELLQENEEYKALAESVRELRIQQSELTAEKREEILQYARENNMQILNVDGKWQMVEASKAVTKEELIESAAHKKNAASIIDETNTLKGLGAADAALIKFFKELPAKVGGFLKSIVSWVKANPITTLFAIVVAEAAALVVELVKIKKLKKELEIQKLTKELDNLNKVYDKNIKLLKAQGASEMEVFAAQAKGMKELDEAYKDHYTKLWEMYGKNDDLVKEAAEKSKEYHQNFVAQLEESRYSLESMLSSVEKADRQSGMTELEKTVEDLNTEFAQAKELAGSLFMEGIINAQEYLDYLTRIRENLPKAIEQAKKKINGKGGKDSEYENLIKALAKYNKSEEELLREQYNKDLELLKKHHKDVTVLKQRFYDNLRKLREKNFMEEYKASVELNNKLIETYLPEDKLKAQLDNAKEEFDAFNNALAAGWNFDPSDNKSITSQMLTALEDLKIYGVTSEKEFEAGYRAAQRAFEQADAALRAFKTKDAEQGLENVRDMLDAGSKEWYEADANLKKAQLDNLVQGMDESMNEFEARKLAALKAYKEALALVESYDIDEEQRRKNSNAETIGSQYGTQTIEYYEAMLDAALWYKENLIKMDGETDAEFFARKQQAQNDYDEWLRQKRQAEIAYTIEYANAIADVMGSIADAYEDDIRAQVEAGKISQKEGEKRFEQVKGMQIAIATIQMLAGIATALSGVFTTKSGPWDIALAAAQAATIAASGIAQISKIKNTKLGSSSSNSSTSYAVAQPSTPDDFKPSYTENLTGEQENEDLKNALMSQPIYVRVSDIDNAQEGRRVRTSETTF